LGAGFNNGPFYATTNAIVGCNNLVYMGGSFAANDANFNPVPGAKNVVAWNGSNWVALANGINPYNPVTQANVKALACAGNELYVAGNFASALDASGNPVANTSNLAEWNTTSQTWSSVNTTGIGNTQSYIASMAIVNQLTVE
jgi:hypothetical protein